MNKPTWLKDAVAKLDGYYSKKGEKLKAQKLTQEQVDAWNGVVAKVEEAAAVEVTEVEAPKKATKKKAKSLKEKVKGAFNK